ncbi:DJ-1/PfpI family protein [Micrococcus luteus]|nr:DJ-1/PfpI family protein [Micrococcus luteus]
MQQARSPVTGWSRTPLSRAVDAERGPCGRRSHLDVLPSIRTDLRDAGADVGDQDVVVDGNVITSRSPDDLPVCCDTIVA